MIGCVEVGMGAGVGVGASSPEPTATEADATERTGGVNGSDETDDPKGSKPRGRGGAVESRALEIGGGVEAKALEAGEEEGGGRERTVQDVAAGESRGACGKVARAAFARRSRSSQESSLPK